jgi:uncharacterized protein YbjQ (UPF0145 family)
MRHLPLIGVIALLVAGGAGCVPGVMSGKPFKGEYSHALLAVKDYETLGFVIVKSMEKMKSGRIFDGSKITNEMLMEEAAKLMADDVINVKIDVKMTYNPATFVTQYDYTAIGLAIKYTTAIENAVRPQHESDIKVLQEEEWQEK